VPDVINELRKAEVIVWMLTGDKMEAAENIAFTCNLLHQHDTLVRVHSAPKKLC
jgi:P-type E1-E2 ATPase